MSATVFECKDGVLTVLPEGRLDTATSPCWKRRCGGIWTA